MIIVYKITCLINQKIYIGITSQSLVKRWYRHCRLDKKNCYLQLCIGKYGKENFTIEELFSFKERDAAIAKEIELIKNMKLNISIYPEGIGMNMTDGGEGTINYKTTELHRKNLSNALKGKKRTKAHRINIRNAKIGEKNPMYGKQVSEKQRESARKLFKERNPNGKGVNSVNYGKEGYWKGKKRSPEDIEKIRMKMLGQKRRKRTEKENERNREKQLEWLKNNKHPALGQKRSEESREKMRIARLNYVANNPGKYRHSEETKRKIGDAKKKLTILV